MHVYTHTHTHTHIHTHTHTHTHTIQGQVKLLSLNVIDFVDILANYEAGNEHVPDLLRAMHAQFKQVQRRL